MNRSAARDVAAFVIGATGLMHETIVNAGERPTLIAAFLSLMLGPAFFRLDERKKNGAGE